MIGGGFGQAEIEGSGIRREKRHLGRMPHGHGVQVDAALVCRGEAAVETAFDVPVRQGSSNPGGGGGSREHPNLFYCAARSIVPKLHTKRLSDKLAFSVGDFGVSEPTGLS
jgi:hypothetical protein